jgi:hypothetical protein
MSEWTPSLGIVRCPYDDRDEPRSDIPASVLVVAAAPAGGAQRQQSAWLRVRAGRGLRRPGAEPFGDRCQFDGIADGVDVVNDAVAQTERDGGDEVTVAERDHGHVSLGW